MKTFFYELFSSSIIMSHSNFISTAFFNSFYLLGITTKLKTQ